MKTLLALSGGLDSTYLLYNFAQQGRVVAFWMDQSRVYAGGDDPDFFAKVSAAEWAAVKRVVGAVKNNGGRVELLDPVPITYEPFPEWYNPGESRAWRVIAMLKAAAKLAGVFDCQEFIYGATLENVRHRGWFDRQRIREQWWLDAAPTVRFWMPLIQAKQGKPHAIKTLPESLVSLTLSCDSPVLRIACEACRKCRMTALSTALIKAGCDPDAVYDYLLRRMSVGPYVEQKYPFRDWLDQERQASLPKGER